MSFGASSALPLNDIPLNIQRSTNFTGTNPKLRATRAPNKRSDVQLGTNKEENENNPDDKDNDDDGENENPAKLLVNSKIKNDVYNRTLQSQGSSCTETTSDGSDVVNLTNSRNFDRQSNTVTSEKQVALFIGDLPQNVTEENLTEVFGKFKSLTSVKICVDSTSKKSLGYGYLNFGDQNDADEAVEEFNYRTIFGREIRMMPSMRNTYFRKNIGINVFFSNLPLENKELTTRKFYDEFKKFGNILSCKLDRRKNIGFIYFEKDAAAKDAIEKYNGNVFFGSKIMCGIHFDRNVRKSPEFEQKISRINNLTIVKETLETEVCQENVSCTLDKIKEQEKQKKNQESGVRAPHPNAVFVKNLPLNPNHDSLLTFFSKIGPVKSVYTSEVSKFNSSWAFITYKRIQDTRTAVEELNGAKFNKRTIEVKKAENQHLEEKENGKNNIKSSNYKKNVYLTNLSVICNEEFLNFFCCQERIKAEKIVVRNYDELTDTYAGYVKCSTRNDAQRLFELMENKLLGDSEVKASWQQPKDLNIYEVETVAKERNYRHDSQGYVYRAPAPNYKPRKSLNAPKMERKAHYKLESANNSQANLNQSVTTHKKPYSFEAKKQLMNMLKKESKRCIDFLQHPIATRDENISTIASYIMDVYYKPNYDTLTQLLLLKPGNNYYERIFQTQVEQAIEKLGLQDR